jgi:hypothetical protein
VQTAKYEWQVLVLRGHDGNRRGHEKRWQAIRKNTGLPAQGPGFPSGYQSPPGEAFGLRESPLL